MFSLELTWKILGNRCTTFGSQLSFAFAFAFAPTRLTTPLGARARPLAHMPVYIKHYLDCKGRDPHHTCACIVVPKGAGIGNNCCQAWNCCMSMAKVSACCLQKGVLSMMHLAHHANLQTSCLLLSNLADTNQKRLAASSYSTL